MARRGHFSNSIKCCKMLPHANETLQKSYSAQINYAAEDKSTCLRYVLFKTILGYGFEKLSYFSPSSNSIPLREHNYDTSKQETCFNDANQSHKIQIRVALENASEIIHFQGKLKKKKKGNIGTSNCW